MFKNTLTMKKIPASCCCLISILQHEGFSLEEIAQHTRVSQRTLRRLLSGQDASHQTRSMLTNYFLHWKMQISA
jgi:hypothetical protein